MALRFAEEAILNGSTLHRIFLLTLLLAAGCATPQTRLTYTGYDSPSATIATLKSSGSNETSHLRLAHLAIEDLAQDANNERRTEDILAILNALSDSEVCDLKQLIDSGADKVDTTYILQQVASTSPSFEAIEKRFKTSKSECPRLELMVISDIDDTVVPHKASSPTPNAFPGVAELYRQLDLGPDENGTPGDLHFVTARDGRVVNGIRALEPTRIEVSSVRHGSLWSGALSLLKIEGPVEDKKVENVELFLSQSEAPTILLFGDSTQADARVYRRILDQHPDRHILALIHEVDGYPVPTDLSEHHRLFTFQNYLEAASILLEQEILMPKQFERVQEDYSQHLESK